MATPSVRARSITAIALVCAAIPACSSGPQPRSDSKPVATSADKPKEPLVVRVADADRDGDGIPDSVDRCPDEPEDYDGFQDDDGCPDRDNDDDGVPDAEDRCPNTPGPAENAGCPIFDRDGGGIPDPEYKRVVVKENRIEIKQQIRFRAASSKISGRESFATLEEVAQALRDNARIRKLRVEGHTDSVGGDASNLKLSQARADEVMEELIKNGVDRSRLEAVGYGKRQPIASNTIAAGRASNRRTEFTILEQ